MQAIPDQVTGWIQSGSATVHQPLLLDESSEGTLNLSLCFRRLKPLTGDMAGQGRGGSGVNWETDVDIYTLPSAKQIASGNLLYSARSSAWCFVMT